MSTDDGIRLLVLQEFQLKTADVDGAVARIVASSRHGLEPAVPLLTSIDDRRDVATVCALHADESAEPDAAQRAALDPFVSSWSPPKRYAPRITERSQGPPSYYRLAVTESGINDAESGRLAAIPPGLAADGTAIRIGLLWTGSPVGTHAGLLTLLGGYDERDTVRPDPGDWPLPLSRKLGVRIYEGHKIGP